MGMGLLNKKSGVSSWKTRFLWPVLLLQLLVLIFFLGPLILSQEILRSGPRVDLITTLNVVDVVALRKKGINLPTPTKVSKKLLIRNALPPRNLDLFPSLKEDRVNIVLYVHNRPEYLRLVVDSLSAVEGINETLLVVSHDGFYEEMNAIVESIKFCQVKQIFAPWSPHLFPDSFPGVSRDDCKDKDDSKNLGCNGNPDQYGNHRGVRIVSLKHHWWWMMNTVWDGLSETKKFNGHIMFIEEDHFIFPNAYRNIQLLSKLKSVKCPYCIAANVAPLDVKSAGERTERLIAEKVGNIGYTFNRTVWNRIHAQAASFCTFDDYNWDITMWATIYPTFGDALYTLRASRSSAVHFGKCGLHQGYSKDKPAGCHDGELQPQAVDEADRRPNINPNWPVEKLSIKGYASGFRGWGGWGDKRDQQLCVSFSSMYTDSQ